MHSSQLTKRGILYYILTTWYFYNNSHTRLEAALINLKTQNRVCTCPVSYRSTCMAKPFKGNMLLAFDH